ncbi:ZYRO0B09812p [Zygosaccharomyces rouxii]|uniref:ZYRO0B09812p n=1 Tax=Zygosaccharomyces rouxii (strain ATCC 2623 / CBS 732 / NBRC 1130 / NCYC 568 / NRRL Y-229) TaxID=559307 RepID=C5DRN2_ZYGRC|nr:uncharacterized protein ZYRO0B09812g [Zygosaccharomyces rouxii]CAR26443.1 ZYRO0B09812p [Zygosaccharomyces rouxii]
MRLMYILPIFSQYFPTFFEQHILPTANYWKYIRDIRVSPLYFSHSQSHIQSSFVVEMSKVYTFEQVAEHNTPEDAWLIVDGKVYDVTKFVEDHPGGDEIILDLAGQDGTEAFNDIGHSEDAVNMLKDFIVGSLDPASRPAKSEKVANVAQTSGVTTGGEGNGFLALACAVVFFAVAYYLANMS